MKTEHGDWCRYLERWKQRWKHDECVNACTGGTPTGATVRHLERASGGGAFLLSISWSITRIPETWKGTVRLGRKVISYIEPQSSS